jgi:hypothetical protein
MTEARNYRGIDPDDVAETEADHFGNCPVCGAFSTCATSVRCWRTFTIRKSISAKVRSCPSGSNPG